MIYKLVITARAKKDLAKLDRVTRQRVYTALQEFAEGQKVVDVVKLKGINESRIRVGAYRVRIEISKETVTVYALRVIHRREAYR